MYICTLNKKTWALAHIMGPGAIARQLSLFDPAAHAKTAQVQTWHILRHEPISVCNSNR